MYMLAIAESDQSLQDAFGEAGIECHRMPTSGLSAVVESTLIVVGGIHVLRSAIGLCRQLFQQGIVVDVDDDSVVVRQEPLLPRGSVVIKSKDGTITLDKDRGSENILSSIIESIKG